MLQIPVYSMDSTKTKFYTTEIDGSKTWNKFLHRKTNQSFDDYFVVVSN